MDIRVLVTSYDPIYLLGLKSLLKNEHNIKVLCCISNQLDEYISHIPLHVAIIHIPFLDIETIEWLRSAKESANAVQFIIICTCYHHTFVPMAYEAGISAIVTSEMFQTQLTTILKQVANGQTLFLTTPPSSFCKLNDIEIRILQMISNDCTNKQISEKLNISKRTVERHLSSCFEKLDVNSRAGAIAAAMRLKLIE
ncbi:helix-turn-helix transcriptional regulator [Anoxybacillus sp. TBDG-1]